MKIQNNYFWVRMYDVYHIASKTDATITDTCDTRDPNSLVATSHSRGTKSPCCRVRDALRQDNKSLTSFKMVNFFVFLPAVCLLLSSMAVLWHVTGLLQRALQGKAWSTLQVIWETSQVYTTVVY